MMHRFHTDGSMWTALRITFIGCILLAHASFALISIAAPSKLCGSFAPCELNGHAQQSSHCESADPAPLDDASCAESTAACHDEASDGDRCEHGDETGCCGNDCFECLRCATGPVVDTAPVDNGTTLPVRHAPYSLVETPIALHLQPLHNPPRG
ncbi:MAG TPA: hypothetical protein PK916_03100 [Bacteroidota bacterium]|nr:hypothetical protein [Bacteroidota bacterium]